MTEREVLTRPVLAVLAVLILAWLAGTDWSQDPLAVLGQFTVSVSYPIVIVLGMKLAYLDLRAGVERLQSRGNPE